MKSPRQKMKIPFTYLKTGSWLSVSLFLFWANFLGAEEFIFEDGKRHYGSLLQETTEFYLIQFQHQRVQISKKQAQVSPYTANFAIQQIEQLHPSQPDQYFRLGKFLITAPDSFLHQQSRRILLLALYWLPKHHEEILYLLGTITNEPTEKRKYLLFLVLHYPEKREYLSLFQSAQQEMLTLEDRNYQVLKQETALLLSAVELHLQNQLENTLAVLQKSGKHRTLSKILRDQIGMNYAGWIENLENNRACSWCEDSGRIPCPKCVGIGTVAGDCTRCRGAGRMPPTFAICTRCSGSRKETVPCLDCKNGSVVCPRCLFRKKPPLVPQNKLFELADFLKKETFLEHWEASSDKLPTEFDTPTWIEDPHHPVFLRGRWMTLEEKNRLTQTK